MADEIPPELARLVEFLNENMQNVEVVAVEVKRFKREGGFTTLVPRIVGLTETARQRKASGTPRGGRRVQSPSCDDLFIARVVDAGPMTIERMSEVTGCSADEIKRVVDWIQRHRAEKVVERYEEIPPADAGGQLNIRSRGEWRAAKLQRLRQRFPGAI